MPAIGAVDRAAAARITVAVPVLDPTARLHQLKTAWVFAQPAHRWQSIDRIKHLFASRCPLLADADTCVQHSLPRTDRR